MEKAQNESTEDRSPGGKEKHLIPKEFNLKENKSARLNLVLRPSTKEAIKREAEALGISTNEYINQVLEAFLKKERD